MKMTIVVIGMGVIVLFGFASAIAMEIASKFMKD